MSFRRNDSRSGKRIDCTRPLRLSYFHDQCLDRIGRRSSEAARFRSTSPSHRRRYRSGTLHCSLHGIAPVNIMLLSSESPVLILRPIGSDCQCCLQFDARPYDVRRASIEAHRDLSASSELHAALSTAQVATFLPVTAAVLQWPPVSATKAESAARCLWLSRREHSRHWSTELRAHSVLSRRQAITSKLTRCSLLCRAQGHYGPVVADGGSGDNLCRSL